MKASTISSNTTRDPAALANHTSTDGEPRASVKREYIERVLPVTMPASESTEILRARIRELELKLSTSETTREVEQERFEKLTQEHTSLRGLSADRAERITELTRDLDKLMQERMRLCDFATLRSERIDALTAENARLREELQALGKALTEGE